MSEPQSYRNHARFEPRFHFVTIPVLLLTILGLIVFMALHGAEHIWLHLWLLVVLIALFLSAFNTRYYALQVQDRVIRLEEQLRYQRLLSAEALAAAQRLTMRQIIALRFASDAELPGMVERAAAENLSAKAIKESIQSWRPDTFRV